MPFPKIEFLRAHKQVWKFFTESAGERSVCAWGIPANPAKSVKVTVSPPRQNRPNLLGTIYVETLILLVDVGTGKRANQRKTRRYERLAAPLSRPNFFGAGFKRISLFSIVRCALAFI
jgi:hypothetical protein